MTVYDLTELNKDSKLAELQTIIECQITQKVNENQYGIYIINNELGRGTDFPTSNEIENNGGLYLILGDVFGARSTAQFKGRVCRMQNKGQFSYIVQMKIGGNNYDYIQMRENIINLNNESMMEKVIEILRNSADIQQSKSYIQGNKDFRINFFVCPSTELLNNYSQQEFMEDINLQDFSYQTSQNDKQEEYRIKLPSKNLQVKNTKNSEEYWRPIRKKNIKRKASCDIKNLEEKFISVNERQYKMKKTLDENSLLMKNDEQQDEDNLIQSEK